MSPSSSRECARIPKVRAMIKDFVPTQTVEERLRSYVICSIGEMDEFMSHQRTRNVGRDMDHGDFHMSRQFLRFLRRLQFS